MSVASQFQIPTGEGLRMQDEKARFLDELLLRLATNYEEGRGHVVILQNATPSEEEVVAELKAEGSITGYPMGLRFTASGYGKHKLRIHALRILPKSD
jgi:hypothetical protein